MINWIKNLFKPKEYPVDIDVWDFYVEYVLGDFIESDNDDK